MSLRLLLAALCSLSCVSPLGLDARPCPCVEGYLCCPTLDTCLPVGVPCPDRLPASSDAPCERDAECPRGERCASWALSPGTSAAQGLRACRQSCENVSSCAETESCRLTLHDHATLSAVTVQRLCLTETSSLSCVGWGCEACGDVPPGEIRCVDGKSHACLVGVHPECGLGCQRVELGDCGVPGGRCDTAACSRCAEREGLSCGAEGPRACRWALGTDADCAVICQEVTTATCGAAGCATEGSGPPRCI